eukprot:IDg15999t1
MHMIVKYLNEEIALRLYFTHAHMHDKGALVRPEHRSTALATIGPCPYAATHVKSPAPRFDVRRRHAHVPAQPSPAQMAPVATDPGVMPAAKTAARSAAKRITVLRAARLRMTTRAAWAPWRRPAMRRAALATPRV